MAQNNLNHYSDLAKYKIFDPSNTQWPSEVKDVQTALGLIGSWARTDVGLPTSDNNTAGIAKIATQSQVDEGTDNTTIVTPQTLSVRLKHPMATETVAGLTQYATNDQAAGLSANDRSIVASSLGYVFNHVNASEGSFGTIKLSSAAQAQSGEDHSSAATPLRVKEMIAKFAPVAPTYGTGNESTLGLVRLATVGQTAQGTLRDGFAVSPHGFFNTRASESSPGTVRFGNQNEINAGVDNTVAVSAQTLNQCRGSVNKYGVVKLANRADSDPTTALAATAGVVYIERAINGKTLNGDIWINSDDVNAWSKEAADARYLRAGQGGNWSKSWARTNASANEVTSWGTDIPATTKGTVTISTKFKYNNDNSTVRSFYFQIRVNGNPVAADAISLSNYKGGKSGHSWLFEGFGTKHYEFYNVPAGATIEIVPTGTYLVDSYCSHLTLNS